MLFRWRTRFSHLLLGFVTFAVAFGLSILLDTGAYPVKVAVANGSNYGMVDPVGAQYEASYSVYVEQCATCHVALPPAVLPTDTWQALVTDPAHYGVVLPAFTQFDQRLMLNYLQAYSVRHKGGGPLPYRLQDSRYFQALHPNLDLPQPLNLQSCTSCHLKAGEQDYALGSNSAIPSASDPSSN